MIEIKPVDYNNPKQLRVLKSCLSEWFRNPKDLNLTSPRMRYPFNFDQWLKMYALTTTVSYVLSDADWIVAHISLRFHVDQRRAHIFHLIVDSRRRGEGHGKHLIGAMEAIARERDCEKVTLFVRPGNELAISLYEALGYMITADTSNERVAMEKIL
ncbi:MAG: GNAT family N-acetyltransferase [Candidatus Neomarinimicrobiota bacterium]